MCSLMLSHALSKVPAENVLGEVPSQCFHQYSILSSPLLRSVLVIRLIRVIMFDSFISLVRVISVQIPYLHLPRVNQVALASCQSICTCLVPIKLHWPRVNQFVLTNPSQLKIFIQCNMTAWSLSSSRDSKR